MPGKLALFNNKVARRIFISFVLAALIPISILGALSYKQVGSQLSEQTAKSLQKSSKDYAMALIDRLTLAENSLHFLASKIKKSAQGDFSFAIDHQHTLEDQFIDLVILEKSGKKTPLVKHSELLPTLTAAEIKEIDLDKTVIKAGPGAVADQLWMAINLVDHHPEAGILIATLKPEQLWDADSVTPNQLWVIGYANQLLFASEPDIELPAQVKAGFAQTNSGQFSWQDSNDSYVGSYWKIPIKTIFSAPDIIIVQAQTQALAFAAIRQFSAIYPPVIVLSMLIVVYLSTKLITKYLAPLEGLKTATFKIAEGDFSHRVNIQSHDEFEALADSFNEMTRRLSSQFAIMSTMAEIDRHILSALNAEDIIEIALTRLPDILYCDLIAIAKLDPDRQLIFDSRSRRQGQVTQFIAEPVKLTAADNAQLLEMQHNIIEIDSDSRFSAYLAGFGVSGAWRYLIIPIVINSSLSALLCLGYKTASRIPPESYQAARNFGDRIAVALSNAAWEEKLYQQAHYDALTGLPNRLVLNDRLNQELVRAKRDNTQLAVLFIDLDRFKNINDSMGHAAGDELLTKVAQVFVQCVSATDLVVRIGGDEFVIVITDLQHLHNPMLQVSSVAEDILSALNQTLVIAGQPMTFTASLGIAVFPNDADNIQDLLKNADAAMYHAKNEGRAGFRFYSPALNAAALENIKLEHDLRSAIAKNELMLYYQPKVDVLGRIVGAEALIRWQHAELGMISPAKFIPLAEQTNLIVDIGDWGLEQTCLLVKSLQLHGPAPVRISVNLSAIEFKRTDLVEKVTVILTKTGVDPDFIELELTESVAIGDTKSCIQRML
ncbi:MAG: diguanylate cyclase, partial [Methylococcales bacterium]